MRVLRCTFRSGLYAALLFAPAPAVAAGYVVAPPPAWVVPVAADLDGSAPGADSGSVVHLLSDRQVRVGRGVEDRYGHWARRFLTAAGVEEGSSLRFEFDPTYERLTIHHVRIVRGGRARDALPRSRIEVLRREPDAEASLYDGRLSVHVLVDDVREGDVLDYAFTVSGVHPALGGRFSDTFRTAFSVPLRRFRYRLLWPAGRVLSIQRHRDAPEPERRHLAGETELLWEARDPAPVPEQKSVPAGWDARGWVELGEFASWTEVAAWGRALYEPALRPTPGIRRRAEEIAREAEDPASRALCALRFAQDDVRYLGIEMGAGALSPTAPDVVLARRFGDCKDKSVLLAALLRALGMDAVPALTLSHGGLALEGRLPGPWAFDHAIVRLVLGGRTYWLDATDRDQGGGLDTMEAPDYGFALPLAADTIALSPMPRTVRKNPTTNVLERWTLSAKGGPAGLVVETTTTAGDADAARARFHGERREQIERQYLDFYARRYPSIRAAGPIEVSDDREGNVFVTRERYDVPGFWTREDGTFRVCEVWADTVDSALELPAQRVRQAPFALRHPVHVRHVTRLEFPERPDVPPEDQLVENPAFRLSYRSRVEGRVATLEYELKTLDGTVPLDKLGAYVAAVDSGRDLLSYRFRQRAVPAPPPAPVPPGVNWPVVLVVGLALVPFTLLARRAARGPQAPPPLAPPRPFGGWLVLLGLGVNLSPFTTLAGLVGLRSAYALASWTPLTQPGNAQYHPAWAPLLLYELLGNEAIVVWAILGAILFWKKSRRFPAVYATFLVFVALQIASDGVLSHFVPAVAHDGAPAGLGRALVGALLWAPYLMRSKRVKATFVN